MKPKRPDMDPSWWQELKEEFGKAYMVDLRHFLAKELKTQTIYPPMDEVFMAYKLTPFDQVRVVILGQDPYHGQGQAHGLSFSVKARIRPPPSLQNIFKEIQNDLALEQPEGYGTLTQWSQQGVFLLNAVCTVRAGAPASHKARGWEQFTDRTLALLNEKCSGLVFLLWGKNAQEKRSLLDSHKHKVLMAAHPSPYSAQSGFFGSRHFSLTNAYLRGQGRAEINWQITAPS